MWRIIQMVLCVSHRRGARHFHSILMGRMWFMTLYLLLRLRIQQIARRDKKAFLSDHCKEIEANNRMKRLEISSRKLEIPREHFMQRWAQ